MQGRTHLKPRVKYVGLSSLAALVTIIVKYNIMVHLCPTINILIYFKFFPRISKHIKDILVDIIFSMLFILYKKRNFKFSCKTKNTKNNADVEHKIIKLIVNNYILVFRHVFFLINNYVI